MLKKTLLGCAALLLSSNVLAETYIYLTNNTDQTLTINVSDRGGDMDEGSHWWQRASSVKPYETVRFLEMNRDTGVTSGETFYFDSTVTAPDGSTVMLQQYLRGTTFFSDIYHGTQNSAWRDDRSRYVDNYTFAGGPVQVAYKAVGARSNGDDIYYVIHPEQDYPSRAASNNFKVLAYNVWALLPGIVSKSVSERLEAMPSEINGYDAIVFSELFDNSRRETFLNAISSEYPHQTSVVDASGDIEDGGVLIVSRWPIETSDHIVFNDCGSEDCLSAKGVKYARINKGGNKFHVFGTHAQAFTGADNQAIRVKQFQQMRSYVDSKNIASAEPVIMAGDFNVDKEDYPQEYADMLNTLSAIEVVNANAYKYTADGAKNGWHDNEAEILDYVLYSSRHLAPSSSAATVIIPRSITDSVFEKYDLSDHFAVRADMTFNLPANDPNETPLGDVVAIQNKWGCSTNDSRCNKYIDFSTGSGDVALGTSKINFQLVPVAGETDTFYIRTKWGCDANHARCDDWLSFSGTTIRMYASDGDKVPWKLIPVAGKSNTYHIKNRWNCASGDSRCDYDLSFGGNSLKLYANDPVEWQLTTPAQ